MALDESVGNLEELESNGIQAYIDPKLREALTQFGEISVDYVRHGDMGGGFMISVGSGGSCGDGSCSC